MQLYIHNYVVDYSPRDAALPYLLSTIAQGMQLYCIRGCRFTVFVLEVAVLGWTLGVLLDIPWQERAGAVSLEVGYKYHFKVPSKVLIPRSHISSWSYLGQRSFKGP